MLRHYLRVAFRTLRRQRGYTAINVVGLAIGLACCFVIVVFVQHERTFDGFHARSDRLYRLIADNTNNGARVRTAVLGSAYAVHLPEAFPEVERTVRVRLGEATLGEGTRQVKVDRFAFADPAFLEVFSFPLLRGDPATALDAPNAVVLTERAARVHFGSADPIGQTLRYGNERDLLVTGVLAPLPSNSHLQFEYLATTELLTRLWREDILEDYSTWSFYTYVLLHEGTDPARLSPRFPAFLDARQGPGTSDDLVLELQTLADVHFDPGIRGDVATTTERRSLYLFAAVACFVLFIACVNFVNLATARAVRRAREVGLRKALGATRRQLARQFLGESLLLSGGAVLLALPLAALTLPVFADLIGRRVTVAYAHHLGLTGLLVGLGLLTGLAAGSYPALYLSAFQPFRVLKGRAGTAGQGAWLRKSLIVLQFSIAVVLLIVTLTVGRQLAFMQHQDLGFAGEQVLYLDANSDVDARYDAFKETLLSHPNIRQVTRGISIIPGRAHFVRTYRVPTASGEIDWQAATMLVDPDFAATLEVKLVAGRSFAWDRPADMDGAYVLNEAAVRHLGWDDPVGRTFRTWDREPGRVIGVVQDFHVTSLHQPIAPLVLHLKPPDWQAGTVAVRVAPGHTAETLRFLERQWTAFAPDWPFAYHFLDETFGQLYAADRRLLRLFGAVAALAIGVTCLGLFGLTAFMAEQRTKEIGIRKVLGASVPGLIALLTRDVVRLILLACLVAAPVAYLALHRWLQGFAYRIDIRGSEFLLAGLGALGVTFLTVSYQAVRAALTDPVKSLRNE